MRSCHRDVQVTVPAPAPTAAPMLLVASAIEPVRIAHTIEFPASLPHDPPDVERPDGPS